MLFNTHSSNLQTGYPRFLGKNFPQFSCLEIIENGFGPGKSRKLGLSSFMKDLEFNFMENA